LRIAFDRKREEFVFEHGTAITKRERTFRLLGGAGLVAAVAGTFGAIFGGPADSLAPLAGIGLYLGVFGTMFGLQWSRLRKGTGSFWTRIWESRFGERLGRLARYKLGSRAAAADRPTELAIAMS